MPSSLCAGPSLQLNQSTQRPTKNLQELCDQVRQTAYEIHVYHAHGHLEKVYEDALVHRLRKLGLGKAAACDVIGDDLADLLVDNQLIVELKTARALAPEHEAQVLGYLKSARIEHGLLITFGSYKFEIRKFARSGPRGRGGFNGSVALFSALFAFFAVK